jgi:hypothetical protein
MDKMKNRVGQAAAAGIQVIRVGENVDFREEGAHPPP